MLEKLFKIYTHSNKLKIKNKPNLSKVSANFGDCLEIVSEDEILIAVYIGDNQALLMSEFWEFAREKDIIVDFSHAIADKWIVQLDKRLYNIKDFSVVGSLFEDDKKILLDAISGKPLPKEKTGPKIPPNPKDFRTKFAIKELKKILLYNAFLYNEQENCIYFDFSKDYFEDERQAAFDEATFFEIDGVFVHVLQNAILIDVTDENINKKIKIQLKTPKKTVTIHEGVIFKPTFKIISQTPIENPYAIKHMLDIKIYEEIKQQ